MADNTRLPGYQKPIASDKFFKEVAKMGNISADVKTYAKKQLKGHSWDSHGRYTGGGGKVGN